MPEKLFFSLFQGFGHVVRGYKFGWAAGLRSHGAHPLQGGHRLLRPLLHCRSTGSRL
jgi:hypothetical protein